MLVERPSSVPPPVLLMLISWDAGAAPPAVALNGAVDVPSPIAGSVGGVTPPPPSPPQCRETTASAALKKREVTVTEAARELIARAPCTVTVGPLGDPPIDRRLSRRRRL